MNNNRADQKPMRVVHISGLREQFIRNQARTLAQEYLRRHQSNLPIDPRVVAIELLRIAFEEPEEIGTVAGGNSLRIEVAGVFERHQNRIIVARRGHSLATRRFTAAHEIGHFVLHPGLSLMRESPVTDLSLRNPLRTPREREADIFASELLMPSDSVRRIFARMFGSAIDGTQLDDDTAYLLSPDGKILASQIVGMAPLDRARLVAKVSSCVFSDFRSLADLFEVSITAMAIQLLDLQLVQ
jgi:IrrE N-terminal-like domain